MLTGCMEKAVVTSHPTRVRGLKPHLVMDAWLKGLRSHPTRVRGLKR